MQKVFHELSVNTKHKHSQAALLSSCHKGQENVLAMRSAPSYRQQQQQWGLWGGGSRIYGNKALPDTLTNS